MLSWRRFLVLIPLLVLASLTFAGIYDNPDGVNPRTAPPSASIVGTIVDDLDPIPPFAVKAVTDGVFCAKRSGSYAICVACADALLAGGGTTQSEHDNQVAWCKAVHLQLRWGPGICASVRVILDDGTPW